MSPPLLTLIVVGAGRFGINHVTTAGSLNVLAAVVDDNPIALARAREKLPLASCVQFFSSLSAALIAHPDAAVVVATPPTTHYAVAVEAIAARRHVLVEKPLCDTLQRADALVDLAGKAGVCLMVDHLLRYSAAHRRLLRLVKAGFVGDVTRVRMTRVNFGTVRTAENVLWSFTPHDVSMLLAICGDAVPVSVACVGQKVVSCGVDDYVDMSLKFGDGVQAQIEASWMHPLKERRLVVYGSRGALILNEAMPGEKPQSLRGFKWSAKRKSDGSAVVIEKQEQDLVTKLNEAGEGSDNAVDGKPPLQAAVEHFLDCARNGEAPLTDGKEGVRVLRVLSAASLSLKKEGMPLSVCEGALSPHVFVHESAAVDQGSVLGAGTKVWHHTHIMSGARLGAFCNIGQNVYIGGKAVLGRNVKVQNNVSIYDNVTIDDDVFLGPSCVFTNVKTPRAHVNRKDAYTPTTVAKGATVGANATIVCGVRLGAYCFVGAGAVVTKDVPPHALVYGNPAAHRGWVSTTGAKLTEVADMGSDRKILQCIESKEIYTLRNGDSANKEGAYVLLNTDKTI